MFGRCAARWNTGRGMGHIEPERIQDMKQEEKKKIEKRILIISLGVLGLTGIFLAICLMTHQILSWIFPVGLSLLMLLYWAAANLLPVFWAKVFEGKSEAQKQSYCIYALIDFVGLAGLVYFVVDLDSTIGAMVYAASIFLKKRFKEKFDRKEEE